MCILKNNLTCENPTFKIVYIKNVGTLNEFQFKL